MKQISSKSIFFVILAKKSDKPNTKRYWAVLYHGKINIFKNYDCKELKTSLVVKDILEICKSGLNDLVFMVEMNEVKYGFWSVEERDRWFKALTCIQTFPSKTFSVNFFLYRNLSK